MIVVVVLAWILSVVLLAVFMGSSRTGTNPGSRLVIPPKTDAEILAELRAREQLERDYKWVVPKYGQYMGRKIYPKDATPQVLSSDLYLSPTSMGKWVKKR